MPIKIVEFDALTAAEETWDIYFRHIDGILRETSPEDPLLSWEKRKPMIISDTYNPFFYTHRFLIFPEESCREAAGHSAICLETPQSPSYQANKHIGTVKLTVSKDHRRKGLGSELLKHVISAAKIKEPSLAELVIPVMLESGRYFLDRLGGTVSIETAENRLYLKDVDWPMVTSWAEEGARKNPGTVIKTVPAIPEEDLQDYSGAYTETFNQAPSGDLAFENIYTPEKIRFSEQKNAAQGVVQTTMYSKECDGKISGLTEIYYLKELGHKVAQNLTGVRQAYKGRGLGKMLKAEMLLYIRREYPDVKYISTGNADSNAPMLSINQRLGFKKHRPIKVYKLKLSHIVPPRV